MILGGLQKNSLIDFPGKVSCVLFLKGCNFDCPYCHNPGLVKSSSFCGPVFDMKSVYGFLEGRKGFLDGVVISGGEPTLQKDLVYLCENIKRLGYSVKLDTNGSRPRAIKRLLDEGLVDYIAMDIKTDPFHYYPTITKNDCNPDDIFSSVRITMESGIAYEFRTTCVKPLVNEQAIENITKIIKGAKLYVLQRFHNADVLHPEFFQRKEPGHCKDELMYLKKIAEPLVHRIIVR
jgi:pyruvate formate lyase activating enzyme